jgi:hypothetical protein
MELTNDQKLTKLISFLESMGITVKSDRGNFKGGLVRYHEDRYVYLNRKWDTDAKLNLIIKEIKNLKLDENDIDEEIRDILKI